MQLVFYIDRQTIRRVDKNTVVAGSKNYVTAKFVDINQDWQKPFTAIFGIYTQVLDENGECEVPWEVLENPGSFFVSAFCGDLITANKVLVPVLESGYIEGQTPTPPTPDVYAQLMAMVQTAIDTANSVKPSATAGAHNAIYRGKSLGGTVTDEQYASIAAGTFDDLYIGDYWTIGGVNYRISAFDYYLNTGDTQCTKHHAVIVPDTSLYNHVMNDTNSTDGGYVGSKMYTEGLEQAKTMIRNAFGEHVLLKRIYLSNATANGVASASAWCDSEVDLMCEQMVYGNGIFSPVSNGTTIPSNYRLEKSQLPLFQHDPSRIVNRATWWLRDVISASDFALVYGDGRANCYGAGNARGVRPAFCITG